MATAVKKRVRKQAVRGPGPRGKAKPTDRQASEAKPVLPQAEAGDEDKAPSPFEIAGAARDKPAGAFDAWPVDPDADASLDDASLDDPSEAPRTRQRP